MKTTNTYSSFPPGTVLHNPVTSEWGRLLSLDADAMRAEVIAVPGGGVAVMHRHPLQTESFDVLAGELTVTLDGASHRFGPGETATVEPGVAHNWTSTGCEPLYARITVTPPGRFIDMIGVAWGLCVAGRALPDGAPRFADAILVAEAFGADFEPVSPPRWIQQLSVRLLAPLLRASGRRIDDPKLMNRAVVAAELWPGSRSTREAEVLR